MSYAIYGVVFIEIIISLLSDTNFNYVELYGWKYINFYIVFSIK